MTLTDWMPVLVLFGSLFASGLGYGIKLLLDIREQLVKLNGRITTCEELRETHEKNDKEKHESCEERIAFIEHMMIGKRG